MKTIIAGSRSIKDIELVRGAISECNWEITELVSGCARGIDSLGEEVAKELNIPVKQFKPNWNDIEGKPEHLIKSNSYGKYYVLAGHERNTAMRDYAEACIVITNGSSGSADMIKKAREGNLLLKVMEV